HVLQGVDHLAFVLALLFGVGRFASLLAAVTAFTLAHTLTLTLSALRVVSLEPAVVEPGIALSVVAVLWLHLAQGPGKARPWIPALAFGLLHGFGFAGVLGDIGLPPHARIPALLGFNLGVEAGQLAFVLPVVAAGAGLAALRADLLPLARRYGGILLGAFGLVLCGEVVAERWLGSSSAWAAPAAATVLAALLALLLGRRRSAEGGPLLPMLGTSLLLALSYAAGRGLAGL
ncbi:MAG: HupE/UreJ family protein, partial [Planctomycetes bacterium]|nr:HupE/UreJ family protein [Planctomycetota bacterium]